MLPFRCFHILTVLAVIASYGCQNMNAGATIPAAEFKETVEKANRGDAAAAVRLTYHYDYGLDDPVRANYWRRKAASLGDSNEQFHLYSEEIASKDPAKRQEAIAYLKASAHRGYGIARRELSKRYRSGQGVDKNPKEAIKWLILAAEAKDIESMLLLSDGALQQQISPNTLAEAYAWAHMASTEAQTGSFYSTEGLRRLRHISELAKTRGLNERDLESAAQEIESEVQKGASSQQMHNK